MHETWTLWASMALVGGAAFVELGALHRVAKQADAISETLAAEQRLRACARQNAYGRNLEDAQTLASQFAPEQAASFQQAAADALAAAPLASHDCQDNLQAGLTAELFHQNNPRLAPGWPNWVVRFRPAAD